MHTVERERRIGFCVESLGGGEEIYESGLFLIGHLLDRSGVEREVDIVPMAVGKKRCVEVLVGDGRKQHDSRGRLAVEFRSAVFVDHLAEIVLEF